MRKLLIAGSILAVLGIAAPAHATGGLQCRTADGSDLVISVGFGHVPGAPVVATRLSAKGKSITAQAPQWWLDDKEMRLVLTDPEAMKTLATVRTRANGRFYDGSVQWLGKRRWVRCRED
ncbi:hypothetical protein A6F68_00031 [Tsuneonella dongtanensis]|uniref:Membrane-bound lysozyme-inhibitor of c-type lysozyme n=1 Tax=Tsuneonella dongtanensis TaxID=692370 RepID=A0A1B2A8S6_9SPHN|nr:hypothetical protein [Tsuneonella dongtanensis]ANY18567.1 hypothetical protein A6F68_00031 [Tsuneonella dongtanensis]